MPNQQLRLGRTVYISYHFRFAAQLQLSIGHKLHRLPYPQIHQDLLRPPQNRIELVGPMEHLDNPPHPTLRNAPPAEDVRRIVRNLVRGARRETLQ